MDFSLRILVFAVVALRFVVQQQGLKPEARVGGDAMYGTDPLGAFNMCNAHSIYLEFSLV